MNTIGRTLEEEKEEDIRDCQALRFGSEAEAKKVLDKFNFDPNLQFFLIAKYKVVLSADDFKDVIQEARAGLWAFVHSGRFRGECSLRTLFWRIAERKNADWLRKKDRYIPLAPGHLREFEDDSQSNFVSLERADALRKAFERWSNCCKGICPELLLAWSEKGENEESYREIEVRLNLREGQGRKRVYDCKEKFRNWLRKNPGYFDPLK